MKTDYLGYHEKKYSMLKKEEKNGWNSQIVVAGLHDIIRGILKNRKVRPGKFLELGCGDGQLSILLARDGFDVTGIDISPTAIEWAKKRSEGFGEKLIFREGSVLKLPFMDNFFDVAVDSLCFHCIIGKDRQVFLREAYRVLKPKGTLIIMTKCGTPKDPDYPFDPISRCKIVDGAAVRYWGLSEDITNEIKKAGFIIKNSDIHKFKQDLLAVDARKP